MGTSSSTPCDKNNPLLRVVFIQRVLRFMPESYFVLPTSSSDDDEKSSSSTRSIKNKTSSLRNKTQENSVLIKRFLALREVHSSWQDTVENFPNFPFQVVFHICGYAHSYVCIYHSGSVEHATAALDTFLLAARFVKDSKSASNWCLMITFVISDNHACNSKIFGTEQIRDAFISVSQFATTEYAVSHWTSAISKLAQDRWWRDDRDGGNDQNIDNTQNQMLFGVSEICQGFISVAEYAISSQLTCRNWFEAVSNVTKLAENQELFRCEEIRDAIISFPISTYAYDSDLSWEMSNEYVHLLHNLLLCNNNDKKRLFLVDAIRDTMLEVSKNINSCEGVYYWCVVVISLSELEPKFFQTQKMSTALINVRYGNTTTEEKRWVGKDFRKSYESMCFFLRVLKLMLTIDKKFFTSRTSEIRKVIVELKIVMNDDEKVKENLRDKVYAPKNVKRCNQGENFEFGVRTFDPAAKKVINKEYSEESRKLIIEIETMLEK